MGASNGVRGCAIAPDRGFVLVGVVMFVLALTILGLSLYAISGYEGQFLTDTQGEEQALFRAEGGMAMAQALLAVTPYRLDQSHYAEGYEGVVRATAWQIKNGLPDSTGALDWSKHVFLRVSTAVGGQARVVEAEFTPSQRYSPYKRLFTATTSIDYTDHDIGHHSRVGSTELSGSVWQYVQNASDTAWVSDVDWHVGRPMLTVEAPSPDVSGFLSAHLGTAAAPAYPDSGGGIHTVRFDAGSDVALAYFLSPPKQKSTNLLPAGPDYEFYVTPELRVEVRGICVWLAQKGIRFDNRVTFKRASGGGGNPTLVIVAAPNGTDMNYGDYRDMALWFFDQGVRVEDGVRVFIVSNGHVRLEVASSGGGGGGNLDFDLPFTNIFADEITLMGPRPHNGDTMDLTYSASMDALVDELISRGALPGVSGLASGGFAMVPGTWRQP